MEFELWYLILVPALFAAGWFLRGVDLRQRQKQEANLPESYSRGVSLLLSEEPDKAIDAFIEVVKIDPELIELHHVLGNLFAKRGEFERAIRLHSHLINRGDLPEQDRIKALKELGDDYKRAGLYDRAESTYQRLALFPKEEYDALQALLKIYSIQHEWHSAIEILKKLLPLSENSRQNELAHFYCELAEIAFKSNDWQACVQYIGEALTAVPDHARALILRAKMLLNQGQDKQALSDFEQVIASNPQYMPLIVGNIADLRLKMGDREGTIAFLKQVSSEDGSIEVMNEAMHRILELEGVDEAKKLVIAMLQAHPSLGAFSSLIELRLKEQPEDEYTKVLFNLLKRHSKRLARYQCHRCGFMSSGFNWHCLSCGEWESYPARCVEDAKPKARISC